jgi:hypothetical protein
MALNLIRHNDPNHKRSLKQRQRMAAFNDNYRLQLIMGHQKM